MGLKHPKVLVSTATFNEAANITEWYSRVRAVLPYAKLLVVDGSSPDRTADMVRSIQEDNSDVHLIVRPAKSGLGSAHRAAMLYALENEYEVLVTMDADLSHQPEQIPPFLEATSDHDFVIGTRSNGGGCDYTGVRKFLSLAGNQAARLMIPTGLTEYTTSMRAFTPEALQVLFTHGIRDDGYAFFMETVEILYRSGCSVSARERIRGARLPEWRFASAFPTRMKSVVRPVGVRRGAHVPILEGLWIGHPR